MKHGDTVLIDTTVIIEAHKKGCWASLVKSFSFHTVESCVVESVTGDLRKKDRVKIDNDVLRGQLIVHKAEERDYLMAALKSNRFDRLDDGEKELMAYAYEHLRDAWFVSSQDAACIRVGHELGFLERFVSLEELAVIIGLNVQFERHFGNKWLERLRTELRLEEL